MFFFKRAKRLLIPAIVLLPFVAITAQISTVPEFKESASLANLLPSMFLLDPRYLNEIFGTDLTWITGVLWTVTIEIWFYIVSGLIFFKLSRKYYLHALACFAMICTIIDHETRSSISGVAGALQKVLDLTGFPHFWWFILGVIASSIFRSRSKILFISYFAVALLTLMFTYNGYRDGNEGYSVFVAVAFTLTSQLATLGVAMKQQFVDKVLGFPILRFIGDVSYEMYLVHEVIGVSLLAYLSKLFNLNAFAVIVFVIFFNISMFILLSIIRKTVLIKLDFWVTSRFID